MASSTAVEKVESGSVPELAPTPATTISFEDIAPPTLYIAQRTSSAVGEGLVAYGDLFVAQGSDDAEPTVVWKSGSSDEGVLIYPLFLYKTWTYSDGENLRSWPYGNGQPPEDGVALSESTGKPLFRTYNYVLFVPEYDEEMPVNLRLNSRSQRPAANKINLTVSRSGKPMLEHAFRVTTAKKESGANKWAVPVVTEASALQAHIKQATKLFQAITPGLIARQERDASASNVPAI